MNGDVGPTDTDYSCISFALAEDSGWYGVDYTLCDSLQWCEAVDCSIFSDACPDTS